MELKDKFFAQNWIEQFRANALHPFRDRPYNVTDALERYPQWGSLIHEVFEWARTPQHPDGRVEGIWRDREHLRSNVTLISRELVR